MNLGCPGPAHLERCPKCEGVASSEYARTMTNVAMIRQFIEQLVRMGVPDEILAGIRTWTDTTYKGCTCARTGFPFF